MNLSISKDFLKTLWLDTDKISHDNLLNLIQLGDHILHLLIENPINETEQIEKNMRNENKETNDISIVTNELKDIKTEMLRLNMMLGGGTKKGKLAEKIVIQNLVKHFPDAEIDDTGYEFGKGDIILTYNRYKIMIEVKNYDGRSVTTIEQQKFHRDLAQNDYNAGILVSCRSGIAHKKDKFMYELSSDNKIVVYLSNAGSEGYGLIWAILFIVKSLRLSEEITKEQDEYEQVFLYVKRKLTIVEKCISYIEKANKNLFDMKTNIIKTLNNGTKNVENVLNETKKDLFNYVEEFKNLQFDII